MKTKLLIFIFLLCFSSTAMLGQENNISKEYKETVVKMFQVTGTANIYKTMINGMFDMYRRQLTDVPEDFFDKLQKEFQTSAINELNDLLIPVYHNHLSKEDLEVVIEFYESPTGQRFVSKTPVIMQEAMVIGEKWGKGIGEKVVKEIEENGF
ncbi:DUF2059 domain-containing protein [Algibacter sp. R77976]|uniref:DUF2059 domain-containing protein n=1 Tax=Algibacter sp. R77976 TaxID=3093873 RepID=UPI0037C88BC1